MKKLCLLFSLIIILSAVMTSCDGNVFSKEFVPQKSFTVNMTAIKDDKTFTADILVRDYNDIKITFLSPASVEGFSINTCEAGYEVNISGVKEILSKDTLKESSLLNILFSTIKTAVFSNHGNFTEEKDGYSAVLSIDMIPVSVFFSEEGYLTKIICEALNFSAEFKFSG